MTRRAWFVATLIVTGSAIAAQSGGKDEVKSAAMKLAGKANYSWTSTVDSPDSGTGGRFRIGPTDGKTEKDGFTVLVMSRGDNKG